MSWKNIKEHYRIGHHVAVEGENVKIGSPYISDLIIVKPDGSLVKGVTGIDGNEDLQRYWREMSAEPDKVRELLEAPDTFSTSLPVYTYSGGEIIEKKCEAYGWPNVTHDGCMMYENSYSADKAEVVEWAKHNAQLGVKWEKERIAKDEEELEKRRAYLANEEANLAKLEADYPSLNARAMTPEKDQANEK